MNIMNNGISASVINTAPVHVNVKDVKQPKLSWSCAVKGKVWKSACGMIIENNSSMTHNIPVRKFFAFKTQDDYDNGRLFAEAKNLGTAKLLAEEAL